LRGLLAVDKFVSRPELEKSLVSGNLLLAEVDVVGPLRHLWIPDEGGELLELQLLLGCISLGSVDHVLVKEQVPVDQLFVLAELPEDLPLRSGGLIA
jgi:hypothetical protein